MVKTSLESNVGLDLSTLSAKIKVPLQKRVGSRQRCRHSSRYIKCWVLSGNKFHANFLESNLTHNLGHKIA